MYEKASLQSYSIKQIMPTCFLQQNIPEKKKKRYFQAVQNSILVVNNKTTVSKKTLYLFIFLPKTGSEMLQVYLDFK